MQKIRGILNTKISGKRCCVIGEKKEISLNSGGILCNNRCCNTPVLGYDIIILNNNTYMSTISVPLTPELEEKLDNLVEQGVGENRAAVMRRALKRLSEEEAIEAVLRAQKEPYLKGDLRTLMRKLK